MNTQTNSTKLDLYYPREAYEVIELGQRHGMTFEIVGGGLLPMKRVDVDGWWYETLKSLANIPSEGLERLVLLKKAGIEIKGLIIAHEIPKPAKTQPQTQPKPSQEPEPAKTDTNDNSNLLPNAKEFLAVLGVVLGVIGTVVGFLFLAAAQADPMLIVVLKDNTWVSVYEWLE
jgi:hypothetical protein